MFLIFQKELVDNMRNKVYKILYQFLIHNPFPCVFFSLFVVS